MLILADCVVLERFRLFLSLREASLFIGFVEINHSLVEFGSVFYSLCHVLYSPCYPPVGLPAVAGSGQQGGIPLETIW
jgi:hypothetical protein